jgi:hypothetical protein
MVYERSHLDCKGVCFACGGEITGIRIHWDGRNGGEGPEIIDFDLHPECADWMATAMKRDVLECCKGEQVAREWYDQYKRQPRTC